MLNNFYLKHFLYIMHTFGCVKASSEFTLPFLYSCAYIFCLFLRWRPMASLRQGSYLSRLSINVSDIVKDSATYTLYQRSVRELFSHTLYVENGRLNSHDAFWSPWKAQVQHTAGTVSFANTKKLSGRVVSQDF